MYVQYEQIRENVGNVPTSSKKGKKFKTKPCIQSWSSKAFGEFKSLSVLNGQELINSIIKSKNSYKKNLGIAPSHYLKLTFQNVNTSSPRVLSCLCPLTTHLSPPPPHCTAVAAAYTLTWNVYIIEQCIFRLGGGHSALIWFHWGPDTIKKNRRELFPILSVI